MTCTVHKQIDLRLVHGLARLQDPFAEKVVYHDSPVDLWFINYFAKKMGQQLGEYN